MASDEPQRATGNNDDPATNAASEELRHTSISEKSSTTITSTEPVESVETKQQDEKEKKLEDDTTVTPALAPSDTHDEEMRERLSSPKKKRGRDQDDDGAVLRDEAEQGQDGTIGSSSINGSRPQGTEPQKKRVRDGSEDRLSDGASAEVSEPATATKPTTEAVSADANADKAKSPPQISSSAFANSGFASMAGSATSPFGAVGSSKPSVFGGGTSSGTSGFGALAGSKSPPSSTTTGSSGFGALGASKPSSGFGFGGSSSSGFGGLSSGSVFGSALSNGFGGGAGSKLSSFAAAPVSTLGTKSKPVKAFGAPDSDEEVDTEGDEDDEQVGSADDENPTSSPEEKKKVKPQKIQVEDGESGEATLLHIRAKLFAVSSKEAGWKERGVGVLKINVPEACVAYDDDGHAIPGTFCKSASDDLESAPDAPSVPRLILRQENTHRVILNTALLKQMVFKDKPAASSAQIYFTALEGDKEPKPVNMLLKMNEANAELFRREVASIQEAL